MISRSHSVVLIAIAGVLLGACAMSSEQVKSRGAPRSGANIRETIPGTQSSFCAEVVAIEYLKTDGSLIRHYAGQSSGENMRQTSSLQTSVPTFVDVLVLEPAAHFARLPVCADKNLAETIRGIAPGGLGYGRRTVRLKLDGQGCIRDVEELSSCWRGVLRAVNPGWIEIEGFRTSSSDRLAGTFDTWSSDWWLNRDNRLTPTKPSRVRVPVSEQTLASVNFDAVPIGGLAAETGRFVEIVPDCDGKARYVGVFKVNMVLNATGGNRPIERAANGELVFSEPVRGKDGRQEMITLRAGPNVKMYDASGLRVRERAQLGRLHRSMGGHEYPPGVSRFSLGRPGGVTSEGHPLLFFLDP